MLLGADFSSVFLALALPIPEQKEAVRRLKHEGSILSGMKPT